MDVLLLPMMSCQMEQRHRIKEQVINLLPWQVHNDTKKCWLKINKFQRAKLFLPFCTTKNWKSRKYCAMLHTVHRLLLINNLSCAIINIRCCSSINVRPGYLAPDQHRIYPVDLLLNDIPILEKDGKQEILSLRNRNIRILSSSSYSSAGASSAFEIVLCDFNCWPKGEWNANVSGRPLFVLLLSLSVFLLLEIYLIWQFIIFPDRPVLRQNADYPYRIKCIFPFP